MSSERVKVYLSAHVMSEAYDFGLSTARTIIREIKGEVASGRYPPTTVLTDCGTRIEERALIDYLSHRKALKNEVARQYVPPFEEVNT